MNTKVVIVKTSRFSAVELAGVSTTTASSNTPKGTDILIKPNTTDSSNTKETNKSSDTKEVINNSNSFKKETKMDSTQAPATAATDVPKEEGKTLSKNELKKLAKKAEKEAKKKAKAAEKAPPTAAAATTTATTAAATGKAPSGAGNASASVPAPTSTSTSIPTPKKKPSKTIYYLDKASKQDDSIASASLKASIASIVYNVSLTRPTSKVTSIPPFIHGPVLYTNTNPETYCFGGNGVAKALSLLGPKLDVHHAMVVDELLELERTSLRSSAPTKVKTKALEAIEEQLSTGSNLYLVGDSVTAADISIVVTLSQQSEDTTYIPLIQSYLNYHLASDVFVQGMELLDSSLLPPPPFDLDKNPSLIQAVNSVFVKAISTFITSGDDVATNKKGLLVEKSKQLKFGDYQCKEAMPLFSKMKASQSLPEGISSPQQLAQAIIKQIPADNSVIDNIVVNGPGFILCKVKPSYLQHHLNQFMNSSKEGAFPQPPTPLHLSDSNSTVVVDFSSPNIAKEMHVGHLRSTIIGESVCRILEFVGADVKRVNHVGDWGTQFGMLITYLKESCPDFGKGDGKADTSSISDLTVFYKNAKKRFDEDEEFKNTSRLTVVKLQAGDEECRAIWQVLCDISRVEFEKVYKHLDITLEECGESFYNDKIPAVVDDFANANLCQEDGGAKLVFVPKYKIPLMLQKSDGGYGYDSTDMAALKYRLFDLNANRVVYITDFGQGDHFKMVFLAGEKIGWVDEKKHKLEHIGFGTVNGEDGKRFKTRSGDTVRLVDLLDEAVSRMETSLNERIADGKAAITAEEVPEVAAAMGYGAVKYFDLRRNPTSNYKFSYDEMLDTKGDTAIYLLYANARLESICAKGKEKHGVDADELVKKKSVQINIVHPSERNLAFHLQMFADMIDDVLEDLYPYRVCDFLYALSNAVSDFVTQCKVLDSPEMESRLLLCRASSIVMRQCFQLLGIRPVDRI